MNPGRRLTRTTTVAIALLATLLTIPSAAGARTFEQRIDSLVARSAVKSTTSVFVWDQQTREVLYARSASRGVTPASTMKLLTSAAALSHWGSDHQFQTRLMATGRQEGARWVGSIYLVGGGDPMLATAGYSRDNFGGVARGSNLSGLVAQLRALGITSIAGRLVVDDDYLDAQRWVAAWPKSFRLEETGALGGLTVNQSRTGRFSGSDSARYPDLHAGAKLRELLKRAGIAVSGGTVAGSAPPEAIQLGMLMSPTLEDIVGHMNATSDNFVSEILLKNLDADRKKGRGGSTAGGRAAAAAELAELGVDTKALRWVDGSGLAYSNRVSTRLLGHVLGLGAQAEWGGAWIESFAVAGRTGTLRSRMKLWPFRDRVRGKTGTLRHVSALAGFSDRLGSEDRYGFAVVTSNAPGRQVPYRSARALQDAIAMALVR